MVDEAGTRGGAGPDGAVQRIGEAAEKGARGDVRGADGVNGARAGDVELARWLDPIHRLSELLHAAACGLAGVCHPRTQVALAVRVMRVQYLLRERTGDLEAALALFEGGGRRFMSAVDAALKDAAAGYPEDGLLRLARCTPHLDCMRQGVQGLCGELDTVREAVDAALAAVAEVYAPQDADWSREAHTRGRVFECRADVAPGWADDESGAGAARLTSERRPIRCDAEEASAPVPVPQAARPGPAVGAGEGPAPPHDGPSGALPAVCEADAEGGDGGAWAFAEAAHEAALNADLNALAMAADGAAVEAAAARLLCHARVELARMAGMLTRLGGHGQVLIEGGRRLAGETVPGWIRGNGPHGTGDTDSRAGDERARAEARVRAGWHAQMQAVQALRGGLTGLLREMGLRYAFNPLPEAGRREAVAWARAWLGAADAIRCGEAAPGGEAIPPARLI